MHDKEIYSGRLDLGPRTYFLDVKQNVSGTHYIKLVTTDKTQIGFVRNRIIIESRDVDSFKQEFDRVIYELRKALKQKAKAKSTSR